MSRAFAIGDIHGCAKTFRKLLFDEIGLQPADELYCVGDYIDRGPDSKGVIDLIVFLRQQGYTIHTLRGNHEQMMLDCLADKSHLNNWFKNGAEATLNSFNIKSLKELDKIYIDFLNQTNYYIETPAYIFVHAGLNFYIPNPFEDKETMLWTRNELADKNKTLGKIVVHGHIPKSYTIIMNQLQQPDILSIDVDGGCVYKSMSGMGNLFAFNLNEKNFIAVSNID